MTIPRFLLSAFALMLLGAVPAAAQLVGPPQRGVIAPPVRRPQPQPAAPKQPPQSQAPGAVAHFGDSAEYQRCMQLATTDPNNGYETAGTWIVQGGGYAARDCQALALIGLGSPGEAAQRLDVLATDMGKTGSADLPTVLAQAGQAWLSAGRPDRAYAAQSAALKLTPDDIDLLIDRAVTFARTQHYDQAVEDLSHALRLAPNRVEALIYRGTAYRFLGDTARARLDIDRALTLDPKSADALLERGNLKRLAGDGPGARADWLALLRSNPETAPQAVAARANIEKLDLKPR